MDLRLEGKIAVVSAASKGIGLCIALALAEEGCDVAICARGDVGNAKRKLEEHGGRVLAHNADITRSEDIEKFMDEVEGFLGTPDILVTNAGGPPPGSFEKIGVEDWRMSVDLNLMSVVLLCRRVMPGMKDKGWGRVVNMTSVSVKEPVENLLLSNSIRPGVVGLSKTLSEEYGRYGITVNCVAPGYTSTERLQGLARSIAERDGVSPETVVNNWTRNVPIQRLGEPEEIAALVAFLCSQKAGYISGATIQVDGGMVRSLL